MSNNYKREQPLVTSNDFFTTFFSKKPRKFKTEIPYSFGNTKTIDFRKEVPNTTDRQAILDNITGIEFIYNHFQDTPNINNEKLNRNMSLALLGNIGVESYYNPKSEQGIGDLGKGLLHWTSKSSNPSSRTWKEFEKSTTDPYSLLEQSNLIIDSWQPKYSSTYNKYTTESEKNRHKHLGTDAIKQKYRDLILQESEKENNLQHLTELMTKHFLRPGVPNQKRRNDLSLYFNKILEK